MKRPDWEMTHRALLRVNGFSPPPGLDVTPEYDAEAHPREIENRARAELRQYERRIEAESRVLNPGYRHR